MSDGDYDDAHPRPRAFLIAEVASSSLRKDRSIKSELYARAGVPEYWIVNIAERQLEVRSAPRDGAYCSTAIVRLGDVLQHVASSAMPRSPSATSCAEGAQCSAPGVRVPMAAAKNRSYSARISAPTISIAA